MTDRAVIGYLLDANIVHQLLRKNPKALARLSSATASVFINGIVIEEVGYKGYAAEIDKVWSGKSQSDIGKLYQAMISTMIALAAFSLIPYTAEAEAKYRELKHVFGHKMKKADGRIAAHALLLGYVLVTQNTKDFEHIPDLTLENWLD